jgi:hypothetical protein
MQVGFDVGRRQKPNVGASVPTFTVGIDLASSAHI